MLKIGLVGCGAIGSAIAKEIDSNFDETELKACWDINEENMRRLSDSLKNKPSYLKPGDMVHEVDFIVEAGGALAVAELLPLIVEHNKKLLVISVGGLVGHESYLQKIAKGRGELFIPSGALAGLDAIKALPKSEIESVTLTTTKPPRGIAGAPFFKENPIDLESLTEKTVIFEGTAGEAVSLFPKNINVAIALSLAGIGVKKTRVRILVDPNSEKNSHEICAKGTFGQITTRTENMPFPQNPKTSFLAALSVIASVKSLTSNIHVGT